MTEKYLIMTVSIVAMVFLGVMNSSTAFAQSANLANDFSALGNIPVAQVIPLSDKEMEEVRGAYWWTASAIGVVGIIYGIATWNPWAFALGALSLANAVIDNWSTLAPYAELFLNVMGDALSQGISLTNFSITKFFNIYNNVTPPNQFRGIF